MFRILKYAACTLLCFCCLHANEGDMKKEVIVSLNELVFNGEDILINFEGQLVRIYSLVNRESRWVAEVSFGREAGYCQRGHDLCRNCHQCHTKGCWYYVKPCYER